MATALDLAQDAFPSHHAAEFANGTLHAPLVHFDLKRATKDRHVVVDDNGGLFFGRGFHEGWHVYVSARVFSTPSGRIS